jgi:quercetin dioxygenase-like cupin family protein
MKPVHLLKNLEFHDQHPNAQHLSTEHNVRVTRFMLRPGQSVRQHQSVNTPVCVLVVKGKGMFAGQFSKEEEFGPNSLLMFDAGDVYSFRALDEDLVCVTFAQEVPVPQSG